MLLHPPVRNVVLRSWRRPLRLAGEMVELDLQHGNTGKGFVGEDLFGDAGMALTGDDIQVPALGLRVEGEGHSAGSDDADVVRRAFLARCSEHELDVLVDLDADVRVGAQDIQLPALARTVEKQVFAVPATVHDDQVWLIAIHHRDTALRGTSQNAPYDGGIRHLALTLSHRSLCCPHGSSRAPSGACE